jgi:hypothetical protein
MMSLPSFVSMLVEGLYLCGRTWASVCPPFFPKNISDHVETFFLVVDDSSWVTSGLDLRFFFFNWWGERVGKWLHNWERLRMPELGNWWIVLLL